MNPHDILKYGHTFLHGAFNGVPMSEWETEGVCGIWSTKDILSHLTSYELMLEEILTGFVQQGGDTPVLTEMFTLPPDEFNASQVGQRKGKSPQEVLQELDDTHARVRKLVGQLAPEKWRENGTLPWYGDEYSLDDFITYSYYGHKREHGAQINIFKDSLKARG
jgi:hypothetical protein